MRAVEATFVAPLEERTMKRMTLFGAIAAGMLGAALFACGGSDGTEDLNNCDAIPNAGTNVSTTTHAGAPPEMTGGTITDGTYVLTNWDEYNGGTNGSTHKETFIFAGGVTKHVGSENGGADEVMAGPFSTSGAAITFHVSCPQAEDVPAQYTATATTFSFVPPDDPNRVQTYTKQ
jgi:hypothetical protein